LIVGLCASNVLYNNSLLAFAGLRASIGKHLAHLALVAWFRDGFK
jgi:hypothetical protein